SIRGVAAAQADASAAGGEPLAAPTPPCCGAPVGSGAQACAATSSASTAITSRNRTSPPIAEPDQPGHIGTSPSRRRLAVPVEVELQRRRQARNERDPQAAATADGHLRGIVEIQETLLVVEQLGRQRVDPVT